VKGVELPINILVIVAIAVIVLLGLIALYFVGWGPFAGAAGLEGVKNAACRELVQENRCNLTTLSLIPTPNFDADKDGTPGETAAAGDNLDNLCEKYFNYPDDADCGRLCGCP